MRRKFLAALVLLLFVTPPPFLSALNHPSFSEEVRLIGGASLGDGTKAAIARTVSADLRALGRLYRVESSAPVTVFLAPSVEAFREIGGVDTPQEAIGLAKPEENLVVISPASWEQDLPRLGSVLLAETSHLLLDKKFGSTREARVPAWLDEGLAVYAAYDWQMGKAWPEEQSDTLTRYRFFFETYYQSIAAPREQQLVTRRAMRSGRLPALSRIDAFFTGSSSDVRLAYASGYGFVRYLSDRYGRTRLTRFVSQFEGGRTVDEAARAAFGRPLDTLERQWRASLLDEPWPVGDMSTKVQIGLVLSAFLLAGLVSARMLLRYRRRSPEARARRRSRIRSRGLAAARTCLAAIAVSGCLVFPSYANAASPEVSIVAAPSVPQSVRYFVEAETKADAAFLSDLYSHPFTRGVRVELAPSTGQLPGAAGGAEVLAVADEKARSIVVSPRSWKGDRAGLEGVLMHEMSHLVLAEKFLAAGKPLPRWLDEGLAQYVAQTWEFNLDWASEQQKTMDAALASRRLIPFASLDAAFADPSRASLAYAESYAFVSYLRRNYGQASLTVFIERSNWPGASLDQISTRVFGRPLAPLFSQWTRSLGSGPPWWQILLENRVFFVLLWSVLAIFAFVGFLMNRFRRRRAYENMEEDPWVDELEEKPGGHETGHQFPE